MAAEYNGTTTKNGVSHGNGHAELDEVRMAKHNGHAGTTWLQEPLPPAAHEAEQAFGAAVAKDAARPNHQLHAAEIPAPRLEQPLLLIACGGSGGTIATQFKAILLETFGQMPENVAILYFDSADDPISCREHRTGKVIELERGSESIRLKRVPVAGLKRNQQRNPEILERFGEQLQRIQRPVIDDGAAMERPQGLLAILWNASRIERCLSQALRRLTQRDTNLDHRLSGDSRINVVIAGSTAGGQGSGAMLDLTYMVREKLTELSDLAESSRVVGMFVLPGAFVDVKGPNLLPNTHAFFLELDGMMQGRGFTARYPGGLSIQSQERPFDYVFVLDGVDEQGKTWPNREEVCTLGARALALLFSTEVGMREINNLVNESGVLSRFSAAGFGTYLATAGQAVIRFPAAQVAERCALRQAQRLIDALLAGAASGANQQNSPAQGPHSSGLGAGNVREQLINRPNGAPFQARLAAPAGLEQSSPEEIPTQARNLFTNYLQRRIYDEDFGLLQGQAAAVTKRWQQVHSEQVASRLASGRLTAVRDWLQQTADELQQQLTLVTERQERLARSAELAQRSLDGASSAMDRAAESFILLRRNQVRTALGIYLAAANEVAQLRLEQRIEQLAGEIIRQGSQWVQQQVRTVETLLARLQQTHAWLAAHEQALAERPGGRSEISLATGPFGAALIEHFFRLYAGTVQADMQMALPPQAELLTWAQWSPEVIGGRLIQSVNHHFAPILQITVEDVLALRWNDRSAQQWITRLQGLAAGAWNLDQALLTSGGVELANFLTIGVPDASRTIFANSGYSLVSTHDPERIVALRTLYGASFDTLKAMPLWKRTYEQIQGRTPLHIWGNFQAGSDHTEQLFALGLIFGSIYSQTSWFYYRSEDRLDEPIRLGQGLENAFAALHSRVDLQAQIQRRVETQMSREGSEKVIQRLENWVEASSNKQSSDELARKLRRVARDYAEQLRQNASSS